MKASLFAGAALMALGLGAAGRAGAARLPEKAEQVVDYDIKVRLDAAQKQLAGRQRLTWRNPSSDTVRDLWFHLYLNAFKNSQSTFVRESGGQLRGDRMSKENWGWIDVDSMKLADGTDLKPGLRFDHPDDDNAQDQTVARVELPQPVPPGGQVTLDIEFHAQLPEVFARTGYKRDFFLVGQWFPKIAVYEPAGLRGRAQGGWNCHQFHANSEFYADFGHYRVEMTVPRHFVLGATGRRLSRQDNADGTTTYVHEESNVHDFAWTADPTYVEVKRTFSASADVTPQEYEAMARLLDRPVEEVRLSDVEITVLIHQGHLPQLERHFTSAKQAIKYFGLWYGRYPYPTLTVVDPAVGGGGAGGMEYPTFITAGTTFLANGGPLRNLRALEDVVVHEFGHQFWYGLVASNEFEEAWLDEGFNTYSTAKVLDLCYGPETSMLEALGLRLGTLEMARTMNGPTRRYDAIKRRSWEYSSSSNYGFNSYYRTQLTLLTLEGLLGEQAMARVMRTYHERWRFRHPASEDFFAVASEVSGRDLSEFFRQTVLAGELLDYEVAMLESEPARDPRGVFERDGKRVTVSEDASPRPKPGAKPAAYDSTVLVRRRGEVVVPVQVAFQFEGQPLERVTWDGRERWHRYRFTRPQRLLWARVDPDRKLALDINRLNDGRRLEADPRMATKWTARFLFFVQNLLAFIGA
ncbi:MAG TPA: M1 family metallopeptidase [Vicinamibacteria bacterium]